LELILSVAADLYFSSYVGGVNAHSGPAFLTCNKRICRSTKGVCAHLCPWIPAE